MNKSSIEQNNLLRARITKLEEALELIKTVAEISEGVGFYAMVAEKALNDGEEDGKSRE